MARFGLNRKSCRAAYLFVALLALANGGCLAVAAGAAAGGAAGYVYCKGRMCDLYAADFGNTWAALHHALQDLNMPIEKEEHETLSGFILCHAADGEAVRIKVDVPDSAPTAGGPQTRVCVRVATFGDHPISERMLYQVGAHLVSGAVQGVPLVPQPAKTPEPPLVH